MTDNARQLMPPRARLELEREGNFSRKVREADGETLAASIADIPRAAAVAPQYTNTHTRRRRARAAKNSSVRLLQPRAAAHSTAYVGMRG